MIDSISKPKLTKGLSYVLKTSQIVTALLNAGIDCHIDLVYWVPQSGGSILEGHYWLPNENVPYPRVYIRAGAVPSSSQVAASEALLGVALPRFIDWLRGILALPGESSAWNETLYFNATYVDNRLAITTRPKVKN